MKKSVRLISILMAMLLCMSCMSVGVWAEYADYSHPAGTNSLDHPVISAAQCGSMILDMVDEMLAEKDIHGKIGYGINFSYDIRNIDAALDTIQGLVHHTIWSVKESWVGDIRRLNFNSLLASPKRVSEGTTDLQILYALFGFLRDNGERLGKLVDGKWDNGSVVGMFLDLNEKIGDIHAKIKEIIYDALFKDKKDVKVTKTSTLDNMINEFLYTYIGGKDAILPSLESEMIKGGAMTAAGVTNFKLDKITVYQLLRYFLRAAIIDYGKPALTDMLKGNSTLWPLITGLLGMEIPENNPATNAPFTDDEYVAYMVNDLLDLRHGALSKFIEVTDEGVSLTTDFQTLLHALLETAQGLMGSLTSYDTVEKWSDEEAAALTEPQMLAYLVRTVVTSMVDYMVIPKTMPQRNANGTVTEVPINGYALATYILINVMADKMPEKDYYAMIENYKNNSSGEQLNPGQLPVLERNSAGTVTRYVEPAAFTVLADYMYYFLNAKTTMAIPAGLNFDETLQWIINWVLSQFGGLLRTNNLDLKTTPTLQNMVVWKNLDILLWDNVLDITWLPDDYVAAFKDTNGKYTGNVTRSLLLDNLLYTLVNLDMSQLNNILSVFNTYKGTISGYPSAAQGELNQNVIKFVLTLLKRLLNGIFQSENALFSGTTIDCLEDIVVKTEYNGKTNLRWIVENFSNLIPQYGEAILVSALPLLAESLGRTDEYAENYDIFPLGNPGYTIVDLRNKLAEQRPSNELHEDMMTDDNYFFFGSEDFDEANLYKYYNWREVYRKASSLADKYEKEIADGVPEDERSVTARDIEVYTYRLGYYYDQLVRRTVNDYQLRRELNEAKAKYGYGAYDSMTAGGSLNAASDFTRKTWKAYNEAYNFARSVLLQVANDANAVPQSKISAARELLILAQKQLKFFSGDADYSELYKMIQMAQARIDESIADSTVYFQDTINDLIVALQAANNVDPGYDSEGQDIIDEAVEALNEAYENVIEQPQIAKAIGSTTVVDKTRMVIYGMREKLSNYLAYVRKRGVGVLVYNLTNVGDGTGTGAEIGLTLDYEGEIVQKYTVIIFGDVDGDCRADATDANWVYMLTAHLVDETVVEQYVLDAADVNGDGVVDAVDAFRMRQSGLQQYTIDQRGVA